MLKRFYPSLTILLVACFSCKQKNNTSFDFPQLNGTQYLLTNEISVKHHALASGASSYLLRYDGETYLITAKHLTRGEMGFEPELDLKTYQDSSNYWYGFARNQRLSKEIIETTDLLYYDDIMDDLIMLRLKNAPKETGVFQPNFERLKKGDRVSVIGCEYFDSDCVQNQFMGTFQQYTLVDQMEIFMDSSGIRAIGMSGAPVVDDQFRVVGHVLGGMIGEKGILKLYLAPIDLVKKIEK